MSHDTYLPVPWVAHGRRRDWTCPAASPGPLAFHLTLDGYAATPLTDLPAIAERLGIGRVLAKDESGRLGLGAFKGLGASWAVHTAVADNPTDVPMTVIAATDGNHGRAVAHFARQLGHRARIYIPNGVHPTAVQNIIDEGADVVRVNGTYDEAVDIARGAGLDAGTVLVQDTAWDGYDEIPAAIIDGYATMFPRDRRTACRQRLGEARPRTRAHRSRLTATGSPHPLPQRGRSGRHRCGQRRTRGGCLHPGQPHSG